MRRPQRLPRSHGHGRTGVQRAWRHGCSRGDLPFAGGCWGELVRSESSGCNNSNPLITTPGAAKGPCLPHPRSPRLPPPLTSVQQLGSETASSPQAPHHLLPLGRRLCRGCARALLPLEGQVGLRFAWPGVQGPEPRSASHQRVRDVGCGLRRLGSVSGP